MRLLPTLWRAFPGVAIRDRLDGGFASPEIFTLLEDAGGEYVVAMAKNPVLVAAAQTWPHARRVVIKSEVVARPGRECRGNPRFVVTTLPDAPTAVYAHIYAGRADSEHRLNSITRWPLAAPAARASGPTGCVCS